MDVNLYQLGLIILAFSLSALVQSSVGFAAALLAIPLLLSAGLSLPVAIMSVVISSNLQNVLSLVKLRKELDFRTLWLPGLIRILSLPIGFFLMVGANTWLSVEQIRQGVGAVVLGVLVIQLLVRPQPKPQLHPSWMWVSMASSGVMQGAVGLPGPPLVLWVMGHAWSPEKSRAFLFAMFFSGALPHLILFGVFQTEDLWRGGVISLCAVPLTVAGTLIGLRCGAVLSRKQLKVITVILLCIISLAAIFGPWLF